MTLPPFLARQRSWLTLLLWAWLIFWAGYLLAETMSWTQWESGFRYGLRMSPLVLAVFAALMPPIMMLTATIWKWRKWPDRFHTLCVMYPPLVFAVMAATVALSHRIEPMARFAKAYGRELPDRPSEFRAYFSRSGFWGPQDAFAFHTTPAATHALLAAHPFTETARDKWKVSEDGARILAEASGPEWPDPYVWPGLTIHTARETRPVRSYVVMTDATQSKVLIIITSE